jgi:hypothetical protein
MTPWGKARWRGCGCAVAVIQVIKVHTAIFIAGVKTERHGT